MLDAKRFWNPDVEVCHPNFLFMSIDTRASRFLFDATRRSSTLTFFATFGAGGLVWFLAGGALCIWTFAFDATPNLLGGPVGRLMFGLAAGGLLWSVSTALQFLFQRPRPFKVPGHPEPLSLLSWITPSFPSGHATLAFAAAAVLALTTGWVLPFFLCAAIVALSRVAVGVHYLGDAIAGAFLGILGFYGAVASLLLFSSSFS